MNTTKSPKMNAIEIHDQGALASILSLLKENKLPYEDLVLDGNLFVSYEDPDGKLLGTGGLELYGEYSLLRSVVVANDYRGKKFGKAIVGDLLARAEQLSLKKVFLLTQTAHDFFIALGFKDVFRESVPDQVRTSSEFTSVCPVSALCMEFEIR